MRRIILHVTLGFVALAGCNQVRVEVDCRLTSDQALWTRLDGPRYCIRGVSQEAESSLSFEEFSALLVEVLKETRPSLHRVSRQEPPNLFITLHYDVIDLGSALESYPVHRSFYGGAYFYGYAHHPLIYDYMGTETRTVHVGYQQVLFLSAWLEDATQSGGKRVIWEGNVGHLSSTPSLKQTMPYLMVAVAPYYGQSTEQPITVKLKRDDPRVKALRGRLSPIAETMPAPAHEQPHH